MKRIPILEGGILERRDIRSGRIYRKGSDPKYGVIYSCNKDGSDNDLGLDSAGFRDAWIGSVSAPESNKDQFFTILGAYYYQDNHPDKPKTTRVFGIAESEFGVTEGGSTDLHDAGWILEDDRKPSLDESLWSKTHGKHHGWTFIVNLKERDQYPKSELELKIFKEEKEVEPPFKCPEITKLESVQSKKDDNTSSCTFTAQITGDNAPEKYEWDCGDGHKDTSTQPTLSHDYKMPAPGATVTHTVKVTAVGPRDCRGEAETQITLTTEKPTIEPPVDPPVDPPCPPICNYLQLIVAFFMALTFCTILFAWVDRSDQAEESGSLVPMIFVFGGLALACIFFWFKKGCPIGKKQWMGIFSIVFLTIFLVGLYILGCVSWVIIILALVLAGFCFYMYKKCGATVRELILAVVVCFLAFCVAGLWIASRVLDCC